MSRVRGGRVPGVLLVKVCRSDSRYETTQKESVLLQDVVDETR
jgi:hypothetical protein